VDQEIRPRRVGPIERPGALGGKRDLNRRKRVQDLVEAGLSLFLACGIEAVTIDEVARKAGMAKGNFYRYFRDKTDLVEAVIQPVRAAVRSAIEECERQLRRADGPEATVAAYAPVGASVAAVLAAHPGPTQLYLQERRAPGIPARRVITDLASEFDERAIALTRVAVERGLLSVDDPRVSALAVVGAVEGLALASLRREFFLDPVQTTNTLISIVLDGIRND
jgi:AcrR family transcriptional regulator